MSKCTLKITGTHAEADPKFFWAAIETFTQHLYNIGIHNVEVNMEFNVEESVEEELPFIEAPPVPEPVITSPTLEIVEEEEEEQAAVLSVDFGSVTAAEIADKYNLTDSDFEGLTPTGSTGYTAGDVRKIVKSRA